MAVTDQKLEWVITEYGKRRITELLSNPDDRVRISIMNIGSSNADTPKDREGDVPANGDGKLYEQVNPKGIPIFEKGIAQDRENTVYFKAIIDENMCGYEISEIALYEERNGVEKMFAVGVGQPIAKPDIQHGYLMSIEYTLYIESTNLLNVYDRIELDPNNEFLKETDIDTLYRTILYVEGNLAEQISNNTHIIGLGRAQELNDLISNTQLKYNAAAISTYYSSMANSVKDLSSIIGFWSFHYTDNYGLKSNIRDFSTYDNYMSTNSLLSSYQQDYLGVLSSLNFEKDDFYSIDVVPNVIAYTKNIELGKLKNHDWVGQMLYAPDYNGWSYGGQIYDEEMVKNEILEYYTKAQGANHIKTTDPATGLEVESITINVQSEWIDEEQMIPNPYAGDPVLGDLSYAPHIWTYNANTAKWVSEHGKVYDVLAFQAHVVSYSGVPVDGDVIEMTTTLKPDRNELINFTGKQFDLIRYVDENGVNKVYDSPFTFIASLKHNARNERNTILAQSNYFVEKHNFEIVKTEDNAIEVTLFSGKSDSYVRFRTAPNTVPSAVYNLVVAYNPNYDEYMNMDPKIRVYINNKTYDTTRELNFYTGMQENLMETTSYVSALVDGKSTKINTVNAQICMLALIREEFDTYVSRCNSLILNSLCGKNVYYRV